MSKVNIYFGENGDGKTSYLVNEISKNIKKKKHTLAICNSIFRKFQLKDTPNYQYFGISNGPIDISLLVKNRLAHALLKDEKHRLAMALEYVGFEPIIQLKFDIKKDECIDENEFDYVSDRCLNLLKNKEKYTEELIEQGIDLDSIISFFEVIQHPDYYLNTLSNGQRTNDFNGSVSGEITIDLKNYIFIDTPLVNPSLFSLTLLLEKELTSLKILGRIDVFVKKGNGWFNLRNASSGEQYMLGLMTFISSNIQHKSVIIIDEPENSLHPKWQQQYISQLLDISHYYDCEIKIATHSPIIASTKEENITLWRIKNNNPYKVDGGINNIENIYMNYFDFLTPENRFLSEFCNELLNDFNQDVISYDESVSKIKKITEKSSSDERQGKFLDGILEIIKKIKKQKENRNVNL